MNFCVTISDPRLVIIKEHLSKFEFGEIRLDLTGYEPQMMQEIFGLHPALIATMRPCGVSDEYRIDILKKAIDFGAKYVDIEIETEESFIVDLIKYAHEHNCKTIVSYHNFKKTDNYEYLHKIATQSFSLGADIIKIATYIKNTSDLKPIYKLNAAFENIIAFGMGEKGKITRLNTLFNGAPFTYVYYQHKRYKLAEGQLKYQQVKNILKLMEE